MTHFNKNTYHVLGIMSGTSLDGIDIAEITFHLSETSQWDFQITHAATMPYPAEWRSILKEGIHFSEGRLKTLNTKYTNYLAEVISKVITEKKIENLDAVCSHGHTILHQPENRRTLQIGNLQLLADLLGETVVCDFRVQDVALGGQGAPLVPIGDQLLFPEYDACLNLGGFANCSFEKEGQRIAYDICPVNIVLNSLAETLHLPYDDRGKIARNGTIDISLLDVLNKLQFYKLNPPKSLGLEWVQEFILPVLEKTKISAEDKIATFTEHVAVQLAAQFAEESYVLVTGGGAYNDYLLERVQYHKKLRLEVPSPQLIEYKEALVFGLLGVLRMRNEANCLASVTGAKHDHCSGMLFQKLA
ncbi:MAG: anhydro-N-acetylmuramic acid kinase [Flavobacteriaceae bacterium]|nr:anhydro-N-acetylmuramic acid kinase [Flavobacteriaceae bacterium]|tara:strand:+ start:673 stop:1752 length:1080 start_codon:yes stop_codon:yes gene_type:complete